MKIRDLLYFVVFLISFLSFISCQKDMAPDDVNFEEATKLASQENKLLWMLLGGGDACQACNTFIEDMKRQKIFSSFTQDYLFYRCNVNDSENIFLLYIFLMEKIPNSYILNTEGDVISFEFDWLNESITDVLYYAKNGIPSFPEYHHQFQSPSPKLLRMQNLLLKANLLYRHVSENGGSYAKIKELLHESMEIEPYFYNTYLLSRVERDLGNQAEADSLSRFALHLCRDGFQEIVYKPLLEELKLELGTLNVKEIGKAKLFFERQDMECGELKRKTKTEFSFPFKNIGEEPLIIKYVSTSCHCTWPGWPHKPLMPGESGEITVSYDAAAPGQFVRGLEVHSNAANSLEKLTLRGFVK